MFVSLIPYVSQLPGQDNIQCCTASAALVAIEMIMKMNNKPANFSRLFVYYMTRKLQGRIGQRGAELGMTLHALSTYGVCPEQLWPFSHHRMDLEPNLQAQETAAQYRVQSSEIAQFESFKTNINNGIPIIIGLRTGGQFKYLKGPLNEQRYMPVNTTNNRQSQGHAVTIVGYDDELCGGSWIIANSMGPKWGYQGYGILPYECNVDIGESYTITSFAGIMAGKKISEN